MGRGRSSGSSRPIFMRSGASHTSKPAPVPVKRAPAPAASKPAAQQQHPHNGAQSATPAAATTGGSGLFGTLMASAAGSVAGNYIGNRLFSQGESIPPQTQQAIDSEYGVCSQPFKSFLACAEANANDIGACQWIYSQFSDCHHAAQQA
ncbi:uncharacterized protein LOC126318615 [Schistocerca gregaria]|uniref:uncharacterized protein LOC126318615 n=1 Tax=Schistocerca gregaria TaxID=7010 RepID=UPI00211E6285|nr:uncharacterized protein LOC126318615 [Schistocerca gregaria]